MLVALAVAGCAGLGDDEEAAGPTVTGEAPATGGTEPATTAPGTETAPATDTAPVPDDVVVFEDDFSDPGSGRWPVEKTRIADTVYARGRYRMRAKRPRRDRVVYNASSFAGDPVPAVRMQVEAVQRAGGAGFEVFGVACVANAKGAGYFFGIGPDDGYYSLEKVSRNEFKVQREGRQNRAVRGLRKKNVIRADCIGRRGGRPALARLSVNGRRIAQYRDRRGFRRFEAVGLAVFSVEGGTDVLFDNLVVRRR